MSDLDMIHNAAREVLTAPGPTGSPDNRLWDRALRILRTAELICRMPELAQQAKTIDRFCLAGAVYFADAGLARYAGSQNVASPFVPTEIKPADLGRFSTQVVSETLAGTLTAARIDRINRIITESANRLTTLPEAMILSDARNLDDMGVIGLYNEWQRHVTHGKGVSDILESWKRKMDYRYWQARLKESFRFDSVRKLAEQRFAAAERFMNQLAVENAAGDIEAFLSEPAGPQ